MYQYISNVAKNYFENANMVLSKSKDNGELWIGNYKSSLDLDFLVKNNICVIINCTPDVPYIYDLVDTEKLVLLKELETVRIPVYDSLLENDFILMEKYMCSAIPFILKKLLKEKKNILVNCQAGRQRSGCVVAAVLFTIIDNDLLNIQDLSELNHKKTKDKGVLMRNVIEYIISKRSQAFSFGLRVNFKKTLQRFFKITF